MTDDFDRGIRRRRPGGGRKRVLDPLQELRVGADCEALMRQHGRDTSADVSRAAERNDYPELVGILQAVDLNHPYTPRPGSRNPWDAVLREKLGVDGSISPRKAVCLIADQTKVWPIEAEVWSQAPPSMPEDMVDAVEALLAIRQMFGDIPGRRDKPLQRVARRRSRGRALGKRGESIRRCVIEEVAERWSKLLGRKVTPRRVRSAWAAFKELAEDMTDKRE